ncbi:tetratricopeptide repeat protein, partial [Acidomonas methanolica]
MKRDGFLARAARRAGVFLDEEAEIEHARELLAARRSPQAIALLARLAGKGRTEAQYFLGNLYLAGEHVPPHLGEALRWIEAAAQAGHLNAQFQMALLNQAGRAKAPTAEADPFGKAAAAAPDHESALNWALRAAGAGHTDAQALAAQILLSGPESLRDPPRALDLYRQSAEAGNVHGLQGYGVLLLNRARDRADREDAVRVVRLAAEKGSAQSLYILGMIAEQGRDEPADPAAAAALFAQ